MAVRPRPGVARIARSPRKNAVVTRAEFNQVIARLNDGAEFMNRLRHDLDIQFQRIAQIQADLDHIKGAREKTRYTK